MYVIWTNVSTFCMAFSYHSISASQILGDDMVERGPFLSHKAKEKKRKGLQIHIINTVTVGELCIDWDGGSLDLLV